MYRSCGLELKDGAGKAQEINNSKTGVRKMKNAALIIALGLGLTAASTLTAGNRGYKSSNHSYRSSRGRNNASYVKISRREPERKVVYVKQRSRHYSKPKVVIVKPRNDCNRKVVVVNSCDNRYYRSREYVTLRTIQSGLYVLGSIINSCSR